MEKKHEDDVCELVEEKLFEARNIKEKYIVTVYGKEFMIYPGVFSPNIFSSVHVFAILWVNLMKRLKPKRVLEIGAGAGYNGVLACLTGVVEHVTCTDISQNAVDNVRENIDRYQLKHCMTAIQSDLFDSLNISDSEKFDLVFWNFPYAISDKPYGEFDEIERTLFDPGYLLFEKYVRSVGRYLIANSGRVFIGFAPQIGDYKLLCDIALKYGRVVKPIVENDMITSADIPSNEIPGAMFGIYELCSEST
jgi:methylase of polypeptide subunit release factors